MFELLIDHLEKDWFTTNKARRAALFAQADEPPCAVCGEDDVDAANALVFCDGCNLSVHQDCYGVPCIPEGAWLCRKCLIAPDREVWTMSHNPLPICCFFDDKPTVSCPAPSAPTRAAPSSPRTTDDGSMCSVPCGSPR